MAYASRRGRRPSEYASKAAHGHVIQDQSVQAFLAECDFPEPADGIRVPDDRCLTFEPVKENPIRHIIAIDGGYTEVPVRAEFPSVAIAFFQFGANLFSVEDLEKLDDQPFIDPIDMAALKRIQRFKFTLPLRNLAIRGQPTLTASIRKAMYDFFCQEIGDGCLMDSLRWLLFEEYGVGIPAWTLASCPDCRTTGVPLERTKVGNDYTVPCPFCNRTIYLTDVFRLHEAVDDEMGAGGVLGYTTTTLEQILLVHLIRAILRTKPSLLGQILFIKDGPLAFFGQTANMHKPMRALVRFLFSSHELYLAGLEKSGPFVEHADEVEGHLKSGSILLLDNDYIYRYVLPGKADPANPYGRTTYYGNKILFKDRLNGLHVVTLPTEDVLSSPSSEDFRSLNSILTNIEKLRCDMYDNAIVPVALVNKLVSLADHPSSRILQKFALGSMVKTG